MTIKTEVSDKLDFKFNSRAEEVFFDAFLTEAPKHIGQFLLAPNAACASVTRDGKIFGKEPDFILMSNGMMVIIQLNSDAYHDSFSKDFRAKYAYTANSIPVIELPVDLQNQYGAPYLVKIACDAVHEHYQSAVRMMQQVTMTSVLAQLSPTID